jgi:hypothetical protein
MLSAALTIAVGFSSGGNYDLYARLIARHIGRHIPGRPTVSSTDRFMQTSLNLQRAADTVLTAD